MDNPEKFAISGAIASVPYALLAWAASKVFDVGFWEALGWLVALRTAFGVIELLGAVLAWRLYSRKVSIRICTEAMKTNKFPPRYRYMDESEDYFARVIEDDTQPQETKIGAATFLGSIKAIRLSGMIRGMRVASAWDAALEAHSPRASFVDPDDREDGD